MNLNKRVTLLESQSKPKLPPLSLEEMLAKAERDLPKAKAILAKLNCPNCVSCTSDRARCEAVYKEYTAKIERMEEYIAVVLSVNARN